MSSSQIPQLIARARQHETATGEMSWILNDRIKSLRSRLQLPADNQIVALKSYIERYIDHTPYMLKLLDNFPRNGPLTDVIATVTDCARAFFQHCQDSGLFQLLCEAYLAHRLIEEFNDYVICCAGAPLFPMDITLSNLLIHQLIGEPFSNQLDQSIEEISAIVLADSIDNPTDEISSALRRLTKQSSLKMETWPRTVEHLPLNTVLKQIIPPE